MAGGNSNKFLDLIKHPLFVAGVSGAATWAATFFCSPYYQIDHYIQVDDLNSYIETSLVKTGYVDSSVLELETYGEKIDAIKQSFDDYSDTVETSLLALGVDEDTLSGLSDEQRMITLTDSAEDMYASLIEAQGDADDLNGTIEGLEAEIADLEAEITEWEEQVSSLTNQIEGQTVVEISDAVLVVDGETMNDGNQISNAVVGVDGNYYYSASLLSSYLLSKSLTFDENAQNIVYGKASPEKVKFSWDMVSNSDGVSYNSLESDTFYMSTIGYDEGIVFNNSDAYFYVYTGGEYSTLTFTCGHVDGSSLVDGSITFYRVSEDGLSYEKIEEITLTGEMNPKDYEVNLNYVNSIKVVISGIDYRTKYGMANIYFLS